jgi:autotransporter strand-loop-strand O-heptosyltransferase
LHCDQSEGNWHAEFWKAGTKQWERDLVTGLWARYSQGWYQEWECRIYNTDTGVLQYTLRPDITEFGVHMETSSLGDSLSFMGQIEQMNSEHDFERLAVRTHKSFLFDWKLLALKGIRQSFWEDSLQYPQNNQGVGVFMTDKDVSDPERHPRDWRTIPMGAIAADQLGIKYVERRPTMAPEFLLKHPSADAKGVCIATQSTAQAKYWNHPTGWQDLVNKFGDKKIPVYYISKEDTKLSGVEHIKDLVEAAQYMRATGKMVGISSGLSWLAWALDINVCMISGFTWEFVEFDAAVRIINRDVCSGCWTWAKFDRGDWNWCPQNKGNEKQFECTKTITPEHVWQQLETSGKFDI